jgi:hypothetical protein
MITIEGVQGTDEWHRLRCGVVTASRFEEIVTTTGHPSKSRTKYLYELAGEIITGEPKVDRRFGSMQKGNDREQEAREYYERYVAESPVKQVSFVYLDESKRVGCSPDGLIDPNGGLELKNKEPHLMIDAHENGFSKATHLQQVQGCMWVCDRSHWDLQLYCRGMKSIIIQYVRDEKFIEILRHEVFRFKEELDLLVKKYS